MTGFEAVLLDRSYSAQDVGDASSVPAHPEEGGSFSRESNVGEFETGRRAGGSVRSDERRADRSVRAYGRASRRHDLERGLGNFCRQGQAHDEGEPSRRPPPFHPERMPDLVSCREDKERSFC